MDLKLAIDDFLLYIQIEKNYSSHTVCSYEYDLKSFYSFLSQFGSSTNLDDVNKTNVRRFIHYQLDKQKQSPRSLNRKISCLKSFTRYCLNEKYMDQDFMIGIEIPKSAAKLVVYMTIAELQQLFRTLEHDSSRFSTRNEVMFKLLATTGMRRSELERTVVTTPPAPYSPTVSLSGVFKACSNVCNRACLFE